jgi:hypothetical protein
MAVSTAQLQKNVQPAMMQQIIGEGAIATKNCLPKAWRSSLVAEHEAASGSFAWDEGYGPAHGLQELGG